MTKAKPSLEIDPDAVRHILTSWIRERITRAGFERAVLGLSGGVDSSLTCMLTVEALGPDNVLALRMPYKTSPSETLQDAGMIIEATGAHELTVPITEMVDPLFARFPNADRIRRGNAMARARMIVLYDQSAAFDGLVMGTGNKTEILLGYTTLYGDAACALLPLGDLYKTQVRQLARAMGVPDVILQKPPSADLWIGQTDEGELGLTYEEVDHLLLLLVDARLSPEDCVEAGFSRKLVQNVIAYIQRNYFKRVTPPIALLSDQGIDEDFLSRIAWQT